MPSTANAQALVSSILNGALTPFQYGFRREGVKPEM